MTSYRIEALNKNHDRKSFACGAKELDEYFCRRVQQDVRRHIAKCFVAIDIETGELSGFYTMSASSLALEDVPEAHRKKLPYYPAVPVVLIGRLAVSTSCQGRGLGAAMLADAIFRISGGDVGAFAIIVDAMNEKAASFYRHFGFEKIIGLEKRLILPMATALKVFG